MYEKELKVLEAQHREELKNLRRNYRLAARSVSPTRIIRKHPMIAMGSAAALGVLVAPSWGKAKRYEEPPPKRSGRGKSNWMGTLLRLGMRKMGIAGGKAPSSAAASSNGHSHAQGLPEALTQLVEKIASTMMVMNSLGKNVLKHAPVGGMGGRAGGGDPEFIVADVGTVDSAAGPVGSATSPVEKEAVGV